MCHFWFYLIIPGNIYYMHIFTHIENIGMQNYPYFITFAS